MSSGVINFKDSFLSSSKFDGQSYRPVTLDDDDDDDDDDDTFIKVSKL